MNSNTNCMNGVNINNGIGSPHQPQPTPQGHPQQPQPMVAYPAGAQQGNLQQPPPPQLGMPNFGLWAPPLTQAIPVGNYVGVFNGVLPFQLPNAEIRWRWVWTVSSGDYQGREVSTLTDTKPTTAVRTLIVGLLGREPAYGENFCVGTRCVRRQDIHAPTGDRSKGWEA